MASLVGKTVIACPEAINFGYTRVLRKDWNICSASEWQTENRVHYRIIDFSERQPRERPEFIANKLDSRRHNPQSNQVYHIRCLNNKPICKVQSKDQDKPDMDVNQESTIYSTSYQQTNPTDKRLLIVRNMKENVAKGIVPFDQPLEHCDVREEMMLPICETTRIPSAPSPHKYLLRKRRIRAPVPPSGVFYPEHTPTLPQVNHVETATTPTFRSKTSISSLCGKDFTRRRYIQPPSGSFTTNYFDGGAKPIVSHRFDDKYLPYVKAKSII